MNEPTYPGCEITEVVNIPQGVWATPCTIRITRIEGARSPNGCTRIRVLGNGDDGELAYESVRKKFTISRDEDDDLDGEEHIVEERILWTGQPFVVALSHPERGGWTETLCARHVGKSKITQRLPRDIPRIALLATPHILDPMGKPMRWTTLGELAGKIGLSAGHLLTIHRDMFAGRLRIIEAHSDVDLMNARRFRVLAQGSGCEEVKGTHMDGTRTKPGEDVYALGQRAHRVWVDAEFAQTLLYLTHIGWHARFRP